jgi:hypothetical protein
VTCQQGITDVADWWWFLLAPTGGMFYVISVMTETSELKQTKQKGII